MPFFAGEAPTAPTENPPGPDPDEPPVLGGGNTYYLATTGSDSDPGSITNPFLTLAHFLGLCQPGDNLLVRGGTFTGTSNRSLNFQSIGVTSGTSGAPITIAAYTGETPIFNGQANGTSDEDRYWLSVDGQYNFFTFDGIKLTNMSMRQNGVITLSNQTSGQSIHDWTFRNMDIQQVDHGGSSDPSAQIIYLGERFSGLLVEDCIFRGPYDGSSIVQGAGVSADADTGLGATNLTIRDNQFIACYTGVQLYDPENTASITGNVFSGPCQTNIDLTYHSTVYIANNTGTHGDGADIYDPTYSALTTDGGGNTFS